ncbi:predicted protein [Nematostella vectensis]|uniref:Uncharacterized protein n=1 Tax=Nematostella vectensis TaxID=45351 RepID=A7SIB6_NEMVE|nr:uncharacterized protein LOC5508009 [Nematostella vectensis]EDO36567.1 predicted protein [Nematostella vectensis]|eukprot:XP_001628630.1 predicted protein [Nematostella vectensis]
MDVRLKASPQMSPNKVPYPRSQPTLNRTNSIQENRESTSTKEKTLWHHGKASPLKNPLPPAVSNRPATNDQIHGGLVLETDQPNNVDKSFTANIDNYRLKKRILKSPLSDMYCTGQRLMGNSVSEISMDVDVTGQRGTKQPAPPRHAITLNKLYSSLKKLKSRHETVNRTQAKCRNFPFKTSKGFNIHQNWNDDEIFILLGGKSKPVRFEVNPTSLSLLESEFGLNLKTREPNCGFDEEDIELLRKFREKYRHGISGKESPFVPWARHAMSKQSTAQVKKTGVPSATHSIEKEEYGRRLTIHVYLPNVLMDNSTNSPLQENEK